MANLISGVDRERSRIEVNVRASDRKASGTFDGG